MNGKRRISILLRYLRTFVIYLVVRFFKKHICLENHLNLLKNQMIFTALSCSWAALGPLLVALGVLLATLWLLLAALGCSWAALGRSALGPLLGCS